ncbi:MAG: hypothetical protein J5806_14165 [Lentisphaeria bacterium]|nr:hypothetical protein [Lentisphaeria bacterium]
MNRLILLSALSVVLPLAGGSPYPLTEKIQALHRTHRELLGVKSNRTLYLDLMEPIVTLAAGWVDEKGAVIDPVSRQEWGQTTPRFVSSAAVLIHFGRCRGLLDKTCRAMSYCTKRLRDPSVRSSSPDFWMRELVTAYHCLKPLVAPELAEQWKNDLAAVDPERCYFRVDPSHTRLGELANWTVYSSGGEAMREQLGIGGSPDFLWGRAFFDTYVSGQLGRFSEYGMYRDPNDPITYDITTRLQMANALHWGYRGKLHDTIRGFMIRGDLTALLFVSPEGFVPFGGRSGEFHFREGIISALCELEALRFKTDDPVLAGRFRRQARRSAETVLPWLRDTPLRHIKNRFPPQSRHGCDSYGFYSVYSLFASSVFGLAALYADDTIPEALTFAEMGGFAAELKGAFHKLFVNCGGNYVEFDTCADLKQDATGLGRILLKGIPYGLLPAMPFAPKPKYVTDPAFPLSGVPAAVGPRGLAAVTDRLPEFSLRQETPEKVVWNLTWKLDAEILSQDYELTAAGLRIRCTRTAPDGKAMPLVFEIPVLHFNGAETACWTVRGKTAEGRLGSGSAFIRASVDLKLDDRTDLVNRNGVYRLLTAGSPSGEVEILFSAK